MSTQLERERDCFYGLAPWKIRRIPDYKTRDLFCSNKNETSPYPCDKPDCRECVLARRSMLQDLAMDIKQGCQVFPPTSEVKYLMYDSTGRLFPGPLCRRLVNSWVSDAETELREKRRQREARQDLTKIMNQIIGSSL